uniref:Uncharacterized protein n=1 Tax=Arundo donax TaxID=35708 RepID=A0A0A9BR07_ARUDO
MTNLLPLREHLSSSVGFWEPIIDGLLVEGRKRTLDECEIFPCSIFWRKILPLDQPLCHQIIFMRESSRV